VTYVIHSVKQLSGRDKVNIAEIISIGRR